MDAAHIQRLGEQLVGRQETAVSELIKNAFDADATEVLLTFESQNAKGGTLVIEDDGSGMTDAVIRSSWMRISTDAKSVEPRSPIFDRIRAGKKGIGRFSVQRLGEELMFETRPRGLPFGFRVRFQWDTDFIVGSDLHDVFNRIERFAKAPDDHGTRLEICRLRDAWPTPAIERVWRSVILLQPPFIAQSLLVSGAASPVTQATNIDPGFRVNINGTSKEEKVELFSLERSFLSQALAKITASIDADGSAVVKVFSDKLSVNDETKVEKKYTLTGPVDLEASYFIYQRDTLSGMNMAVAANMGRNFGGMRIYRNGFRVLPYGEQRDDWLRLDEDVSRRNLLIPANNRNFFGQVLLDTDKNPLFEETSSREGLLENEAFDELRAFARWALEWSTLRIASARNRKRTAGERGFVREVNRPSELIKRIIENKPEPTASEPIISKIQFLEVQDAVEAYEKHVEEERASALEYGEMLRILASLGLSISVFGHEVKGAQGALGTDLMLLKDLIDEMPDGALRQEIEAQFDELQIASDRLFDIGGYIAGLMSSTESRALQELSVKGAIERFERQFSEYMTKQNIIFHVRVDESHLRTAPMHASEFDSVLLNFLTNSIKSMKKAKVSERHVSIDARLIGDLIIVGFEDNGVGIPPENEERIFMPFFTTTMGTEDDGVTGPGTGLGLKIVSDIAESYGGSVAVAVPTNGYTCRLEFSVLAKK